MKHRQHTHRRHRRRRITVLVAAGTAVAAFAAGHQHPDRPTLTSPTATPAADLGTTAVASAGSSPAGTPAMSSSPGTTPTSGLGRAATGTIRPPLAPTAGAQAPPGGASPTGGCPTHTGSAASRTAVAAALTTAADQITSPSAPGVHVPDALIEAIAWQESQWRSDLVGCHDERGVMQLTMGTAASVNQRYGTSYDLITLDGNASVGAAYLTWLIAYLAQRFFDGDTNLDNPALLNSVIAAYRAGPGAVDPTTVVPNSAYVQAVITLMSTRPWSS